MTPQEQQLIDGLIERVRTTQVQNKDTQAEQHIQQGLSGTPDAAYVLVQTVLVQQFGLQQAQSQLTELKQQIQSLQQSQQQQSRPSSGSFLSHIFGGGSDQSLPQTSQQQPPYQPVNNPGYGSAGYPGGNYPPPPPAYPPQAYPTSGGSLFGGGGGFLRGAMQTAAGVAAGELAFQGMEDLFHGFGGGERSFGAGGGETVVNNYYDDERGTGRSDADDRNDRSDAGSRDDSGFYNPGDDASRQDFADSTPDNSGNDAFSDSGNDLSFDDNSSDNGGFDSGDDFSSDNS